MQKKYCDEILIAPPASSEIANGRCRISQRRSTAGRAEASPRLTILHRQKKERPLTSRPWRGGMAKMSTTAKSIKVNHTSNVL